MNSIDEALKEKEFRNNPMVCAILLPVSVLVLLFADWPKELRLKFFRIDYVEQKVCCMNERFRVRLEKHCLSI